MTNAYNVMKETPADPFRQKFVDGRCKLHMVWTSRNSSTATGDDAAYPQIKFFSDSGYSDLVFQMTDVVGTGIVYTYMDCIDLPPQGFLFDDGMWVESNDINWKISIIVSGGKESA